MLATEEQHISREVIQTFGISLPTLKHWLKKSSEGEDLSPRSSAVRKRRILATGEERRALWAQFEKYDVQTLLRYCELWERSGA